MITSKSFPLLILALFCCLTITWAQQDDLCDISKYQDFISDSNQGLIDKIQYLNKAIRDQPQCVVFYRMKIFELVLVKEDVSRKAEDNGANYFCSPECWKVSQQIRSQNLTNASSMDSRKKNTEDAFYIDDHHQQPQNNNNKNKESDDYHQTIKMLNQAIQSNPKDIQARAKKADLEMKFGDVKEAFKTCDDHIQAVSDCIVPYEQKKMFMTQMMAEAFDEGVKSNPRSETMYIEKIKFELKLGEIAKAKETYEKGLRNLADGERSLYSVYSKIKAYGIDSRPTLIPRDHSLYQSLTDDIEIQDIKFIELNVENREHFDQLKDLNIELFGYDYEFYFLNQPQNKKQVTLLAIYTTEVDGRQFDLLLGYICYKIQKVKAYNYIYVGLFGIVAELRKKGLGRVLMNTVLDLEPLNDKVVSLHCEATNEGGKAFYRKMGFMEAALLPNFYEDDGNIDGIIYQLFRGRIRNTVDPNTRSLGFLSLSL